MSEFSVSTVPADGLVLFSAWTTPPICTGLVNFYLNMPFTPIKPDGFAATSQERQCASNRHQLTVSSTDLFKLAAK